MMDDTLYLLFSATPVGVPVYEGRTDSLDEALEFIAEDYCFGMVVNSVEYTPMVAEDYV